MGGAAWVAGQAWIAYLLFSVVYAFVIVFAARYLMRAQDRERELLAEQAAHAAAPVE